jgi:hypothetical protein
MPTYLVVPQDKCINSLSFIALLAKAGALILMANYCEKPSFKLRLTRMSLQTV